jgi:hypothetical protein
MFRPDARDLLALVVGPALTQHIDSSTDLHRAGVGSGELIRLSLLVEAACAVEVSEDELDDLHTLDDIDRLIARHWAVSSSAEAQTHLTSKKRT